MANLTKTTSLTKNTSYPELRSHVKETLLLGLRRIEGEKLRTYWETGKLIQTHILGHKDRADYGRQVVERLGKDLEISSSVLWRTLQLYQQFPILAGPRELTWAHYCEILSIKDAKTRDQLLSRAIRNQWTSADLRRKIREEYGEDGKDDPGKGSGRLPIANAARLVPKRGTLYTYQILQPDQISDAQATVLIDLGFSTYRKLSKTDLKPGTLVESQWDEAKDDYKILKSNRDASSLYTYKALVERVIDGDTLRVKVDLGFDCWTRQYLRLRGLDAPELDTPEGQAAKRFVERELAGVPFLILHSSRPDKYGRYLADIFYPTGTEEKFLNQALLDQHHAVRM